MAHCEKCIHYDICKFDADLISENFVNFFPNNRDCTYFKSTADMREVRHGRFVDGAGNPVESFDYCGRACDMWGRALYRPIYCSECHICLAGMNGKLYPHQRNCCPNCGTYMDGGKDK